MSQVMRGAPDPGFLADVRSAFEVLRERRLLPLMSLGVWCLPVLLPRALSFLTLPVAILAIGYPGTERLWLLRGMRGEPFTFDQAFRRNWSYVGRFLRLELMLFPPIAVGAAIGWVVDRSFLGVYLGLGAAGVLLDFGLTFVTPALAFTTRSAREALSIGLRMIRSEWPQAVLYVLVPPLAILMIAQVIPGVSTFRHLRQDFEALKAGRSPPSVPQSLRYISASISAVAVMLGLLFKGATAAFYARRFDIPSYGASSGPEDAPDVPRRPDLDD